MWILFLETFIVSEKLNSRQISLKSLRGVALLVALTFPTVYVIAANFCGLNAAIENLTARQGVYFSNLMPVSVEYLVFMTLLAAIIALNFGVSGLADLSISAVFLGAIGGIYVLNNLFPFGRFAPLQMIVPTTAHLSMSFLNLLGYSTLFLGNQSNMPIFVAWDANKNYSAAYAIAWPCSGVESLIIYTITISLFLRKMRISWVGKVIYFGIGAVITYLINILRIATIFILSIQGGDVGTFHDYYGQLYSITWIISYPLIMIGTQALWSRIQSWRLAKDPQRIPTRKTAFSGPI
jgi:thaumarchaeosortase